MILMPAGPLGHYAKCCANSLYDIIHIKIAVSLDGNQCG
ncbi:hypothetical protein B194_3464 [Serratia plymuthica A30]|nr:hypothetical protein B194_3464 [Serratia plymuthica A30]